MPEGGMNVELASRELCAKIKEGEAKLEEGSIEEAETSLREALSLNNEVKRFVCFSFFLAVFVMDGGEESLVFLLLLLLLLLLAQKRKPTRT
jgi:formate hydrogenlyase subunit 4